MVLCVQSCSAIQFLSGYPKNVVNQEIIVCNKEITAEYKNCGYLPMKERRVDELSCISLHLVIPNMMKNGEQDYVQSGTNRDTETDLSKRLTQNE